jgi:hypothetical protein
MFFLYEEGAPRKCKEKVARHTSVFILFQDMIHLRGNDRRGKFIKEKEGYNLSL